MKAVYAGSFDPLTNGHMWIIERAAKLFDKLTIAIGTNNAKQTRFSVGQRRLAILRSVRHLANVSTINYSDTYTARLEADVLVRGIRNVNDFLAEAALQDVNSNISTIQTIYLIPPPALSSISSSMVMSLIGFDGWRDVVRRYVPGPIFNMIEVTHARQYSTNRDLDEDLERGSD